MVSLRVCSMHRRSLVLGLIRSPTVLIIGRDIVVTFLRNRITGGIPVSKAAKWKTAIAMIATGGMLLFFRPWHFGLPMDPSEIGGAASV